MEKYENTETREISLKDLFNTFKKGLWIMLAAAIVCGTIAYGYSAFFIKKTYSTSVKLYVVSATTNENAYNDLSAHNLSKSLVKTYVSMLTSNNFFIKLAENLDDKYTAEQLGGMVSFVSDEDNTTEVFTASVRAGSPTEAKIIADSIEDVAPGVIAALNDNEAKLKIVDSATIPTAPSSPNVPRNTLLAAAAGFVLALIFVFVREALDNKIKYSAELTDIEGIPVLSAIPDFNGEPIILGKEESTAETEVQ